MKRKRLSFARKYRCWRFYDLRNVMFTDESTFSLVNSRPITLRKEQDSVLVQSQIPCEGFPTFSQCASVMVWGCFRVKNGRGGLYFLPKNCMMNGERHKKVSWRPPHPLHEDPQDIPSTTTFPATWASSWCPSSTSSPSSTSQRTSRISTWSGTTGCT